MADATHTPGPWEVLNGCNVFADAAHAPLTNEGLIAVTGGHSGRDTVERDAANARLIAAAPELLAALEAIIGNSALRLNSFDRIFAEAAITKARGQS